MALTGADAALAPAQATHRFKPGERIRLRVTPSHDAHVYCYLQDEARRVVRFYPNRFNPSALVRADKPLEIPGRMGFELVANSRRVMETIACFASERDMAGELPAAALWQRLRAAAGRLARRDRQRLCARRGRWRGAGPLSRRVQVIAAR